jgi:hypothetical protein
MKKPTITYTYRGMIERGRPVKGRPSYEWFEGYSETGANGEVGFPWMTYRECQQEARTVGAVAKFERK